MGSFCAVTRAGMRVIIRNRNAFEALTPRSPVAQEITAAAERILS
jgi:hypothetical protein